MKVVCGWCGKDMGEKKLLKNNGITHGICDKCLDINFPHVAEILDRAGLLDNKKGRQDG